MNWWVQSLSLSESMSYVHVAKKFGFCNYYWNQNFFLPNLFKEGIHHTFYCQNCFLYGSYCLVNPHMLHQKVVMMSWAPVISIMHLRQLWPTRFTAKQIKNCTSVIKVAIMKNTDDSIMQRKPSRGTTKSTRFAVSKDDWNIKEDTGKSMKNVLYILLYAKSHYLGWSGIEQ